METIFIYDPRLNVQHETTVDAVVGFTGFTRKTILYVSRERRQLSVTGCYLTREKFTPDERRAMQAEEHFPGERWRPVCGYETLYEASDHGRVRSRRHEDRGGDVLTPYFRAGSTSTFVKLRQDKTSRHMRVAKLVYEAFHGEQTELIVIHKNKLSYENHLENLEVVPRRVSNSLAAAKASATPIYKIDPDTFEILEEYATLKEASRENFTCRKIIRKTCQGIRPDAFGNHFCYVSEYHERKNAKRLNVEQSEPTVVQTNTLLFTQYLEKRKEDHQVTLDLTLAPVLEEEPTHHIDRESFGNHFAYVSDHRERKKKQLA